MLRSGRRCRTPRLDIAWCANDVGHPRLGIVVPRYHATAVARNRLRRRLREFVRRRLLRCLSPVDLVVRARAAAYRAKASDLYGDLGEWLKSNPD